jgi:hypothetical protein
MADRSRAVGTERHETWEGDKLFRSLERSPFLGFRTTEKTPVHFHCSTTTSLSFPRRRHPHHQQPVPPHRPRQQPPRSQGAGAGPGACTPSSSTAPSWRRPSCRAPASRGRCRRPSPSCSSTTRTPSFRIAACSISNQQVTNRAPLVGYLSMMAMPCRDATFSLNDVRSEDDRPDAFSVVAPRRLLPRPDRVRGGGFFSVVPNRKKMYMGKRRRRVRECIIMN